MEVKTVIERLDRAHHSTNQAIQDLRPLRERDNEPWAVDADFAIQQLVEVSKGIEDMLDNAESGAYSEAA